MHHINRITGLRYLRIVPLTARKHIRQTEAKNNIAVHAVLNKNIVLLLTHNEFFRDPLHPLVVFRMREHFFPCQPFPELSQNAIMSCPSKKVHDYLCMKFNLSLEDEATLLVGIDTMNDLL